MLARLDQLDDRLVVVAAVLRSRGRDADRIDLLGGQQLVDAVVRGDAVLLGHRVDAFRLQVAQRHERGVGVLGVATGVGLADTAQPHDGDS